MESHISIQVRHRHRYRYKTLMLPADRDRKADPSGWVVAKQLQPLKLPLSCPAPPNDIVHMAPAWSLGLPLIPTSLAFLAEACPATTAASHLQPQSTRCPPSLSASLLLCLSPEPDSRPPRAAKVTIDRGHLDGKRDAVRGIALTGTT